MICRGQARAERLGARRSPVAREAAERPRATLELVMAVNRKRGRHPPVAIREETSRAAVQRRAEDLARRVGFLLAAVAGTPQVCRMRVAMEELATPGPAE